MFGANGDYDENVAEGDSRAVDWSHWRLGEDDHILQVG